MRLYFSKENCTWDSHWGPQALEGCPKIARVD